jgi:hypothetical protein
MSTISELVEDWGCFEEFCGMLLKNSSNVAVERNVKLYGRSATPRMIDILIRQRMPAMSQIRTIVGCKHLNKNVESMHCGPSSTRPSAIRASFSRASAFRRERSPPPRSWTSTSSPSANSRLPSFRWTRRSTQSCSWSTLGSATSPWPLPLRSRRTSLDRSRPEPHREHHLSEGRRRHHARSLEDREGERRRLSSQRDLALRRKGGRLRHVRRPRDRCTGNRRQIDSGHVRHEDDRYGHGSQGLVRISEVILSYDDLNDFLFRVVVEDCVSKAVYKAARKQNAPVTSFEKLEVPASEPQFQGKILALTMDTFLSFSEFEGLLPGGPSRLTDARPGTPRRSRPSGRSSPAAGSDLTVERSQGGYGDLPALKSSGPRYEMLILPG